MACKYKYQDKTYNSKEEFISQVVIPNFINQGKVRRNLETQSDLFQKLRNNFTNGELQYTKNEDLENKDIYYRKNINNKSNFGGEYISKEEYERAFEEHIDKWLHPFLSLLIKNNNWVTFFVKSIIQDSAKKGYRKVLFPTGNTASRIEGHTTLEEFKKEKEDRIREINNKLDSLSNEYGLTEGQKYFYSDSEYIIFKDNKLIEHKYDIYTSEYIDVEIDKDRIETIKNFKGNRGFNRTTLDKLSISEGLKYEKKQLEQELERLETEGFSALRPIYNFYENTVQNVLNKQFGKDNVKRITDEYGNDWFELDLSNNKVQEQTKKVLLSKGATQAKHTLQIGNKDFTKGTYTFKEIFDSMGDSKFATKLLKQLYMFSKKNIDNMKVHIVDNVEIHNLKTMDKPTTPFTVETTGSTYYGNSDWEAWKQNQISLLKDNKGTIGMYRSEKGDIILSTNALNGEEVFAHEIIHALTAIKLEYWKKKSPEIYKELEQVYLKAKDLLDNDDYEFSNIHEFYAHLSEIEFVEKLAKVKSEGFWSNFIEVISKMLKKLGINIENTLAEEALNNLELIVSQEVNEEENTKMSDLKSVTDEEFLNNLWEGIPESREPQPIELENFDFWENIIKAYEKMANYISKDSITNAGYNLLTDNRNKMKETAKVVSSSYGEQRVITQAASIAMYVGGLKRALLDKKKDDILGEGYKVVSSNGLLHVAKELKKLYNQKPEQLMEEDHQRNLVILNYIDEFVKAHGGQEFLAEMKRVSRESKNQAESINDYLKSLDEEYTYESTAEDMQKVIDAIEELKIMDLSKVIATALAIPQYAELSKSLQKENEIITKENEIISEKIKELRKKPEVNKEKIEELEGKIKSKTLGDVIVNIANHIKDGGDFGFFMATFASIKDLGDKSLTLLRNRIEDVFNKAKNSLIQDTKDFSREWGAYCKENNIDVNDDKTFEKFIEKRIYVDKEGNDVEELHFISKTDKDLYFKKWHELDSKVQAKWKEIKELSKPMLIPNATLEQNKEYEDRLKAYYKKKYDLINEINDLKDEFNKTTSYNKDIVSHIYDESGNKIEVENPSIRKYLAYQYNSLVEVMGEKDGRQQFKHMLESFFDTERMYFSIRKNSSLSKNQFFNELMDTLSQEDNVLAIEGKTVRLYENYKSDLYVPSEKYYPSTKLSSLTPSERKLYDFLLNTYLKSQENLPVYARKGTKLPSVPKDKTQRLLNGQMSWKSLGQELLGDYVGDEMTENPNSTIPIRYTTNLDSNEVSTNLIQSILLFTKEAKMYKARTSAIHYAHALQDKIRTPKVKENNRNVLNKVLEKLGVRATIPIGTDWRSWFLSSYIDQVFYGKTNRPIVWGGVRVDKVLHSLMAASAFGTLGGVKIVSHLTNLSMSNIMNLMESTGYFENSEVKPLFSKMQYLKALSGAGLAIKDHMLDFTKRSEFSESIYGQIMQEFEPIRGEFFDGVGKKVNTSIVKDASSVWFSPMHLGDTLPQTMAMVATLENIPVTLNDDTQTTLWKALTASDDLQKNWETIKGWQAVRNNFFNVTKRQLDELNEKMHGNYSSVSSIDRPLIRQVVVGQMLEMYRKFIVPGFIKRYGQGKVNINTGYYEEGSYRALYKYIFNDMKTLFKQENGISPMDILYINPENLDKIRKYYTDEQIINIRKGVAEHLLILTLSMLAVILYGLAKGGDDDNEVLMTAASVMFRLHSDFAFFTPISLDAPFTEDKKFNIPVAHSLGEITRIFKKPFAVQSTIDRLNELSILLTSDPFEVYKRTENKGKLKIGVQAQKLLGIHTGTSPEDVISLMYERKN